MTEQVPSRSGATFWSRMVYINGVNVLDGDVLDTEAISHTGQAIRIV